METHLEELPYSSAGNSSADRKTKNHEHIHSGTEEAKKKLPKPILDFLRAPELTTLYVGIKDKLKMNLRQLMAFAEIVNVTLMGLEEEHALETNLHQWLPEFVECGHP